MTRIYLEVDTLANGTQRIDATRTSKHWRRFAFRHAREMGWAPRWVEEPGRLRRWMAKGS